MTNEFEIGIPGFANDDESDYMLNPVVDFLPEETILREFGMARMVFFDQAKRLFGLGKIVSVGASIRNQVTMDEKVLTHNPSGILETIIEKMSALLVEEGESSQFMKLTKGDAALLFKRDSPWNIFSFIPNSEVPESSPMNASRRVISRHAMKLMTYLNQKHKSEGQIVMRSELYTFLLSLNVAAVIMHQLEHALLTRFLKVYIKEGFFQASEVKFDLKKTLEGLSFTKQGLLEYVDELRGVRVKDIEESIFLRQLFSPDWPVEAAREFRLVELANKRHSLTKATSSLPLLRLDADYGVVKIDFPSHTEEGKTRRVVFFKKAFTDHGVFFDHNSVVGSGVNGILFLGCPASRLDMSSEALGSSGYSDEEPFKRSEQDMSFEAVGSPGYSDHIGDRVTAPYTQGQERVGCGSVIKLTYLNKREVMAQKMATKIGLAPLFTAKYFSVAELARDPMEAAGIADNGSTQKKEWKPTETWWMVLPTERLDKTLDEVIKSRSFTAEDAKNIIELLMSFELSNFVHHDFKGDNIMCKEREGRPRRWFIIDYGSAWSGGPRYDPANTEYVPMKNIPYGYDINEQRMVLSSEIYKSWTRRTFNSPPPMFDAVCLLASLFFTSGLSLHNARKHLIPLLQAYAEDHLVLTNDSIFYKQSAEHAAVFIWRLERGHTELYFNQ